jgi:hypothetical protein
LSPSANWAPWISGAPFSLGPVCRPARVGHDVAHLVRLDPIGPHQQLHDRIGQHVFEREVSTEGSHGVTYC